MEEEAEEEEEEDGEWKAPVAAVANALVCGAGSSGTNESSKKSKISPKTFRSKIGLVRCQTANDTATQINHWPAGGGQPHSAHTNERSASQVMAVVGASSLAAAETVAAVGTAVLRRLERRTVSGATSLLEAGAAAEAGRLRFAADLRSTTAAEAEADAAAVAEDEDEAAAVEARAGTCNPVRNASLTRLKARRKHSALNAPRQTRVRLTRTPSRRVPGCTASCSFSSFGLVRPIQ
jgi:hypothetical protein